VGQTLRAYHLAVDLRQVRYRGLDRVQHNSVATFPELSSVMTSLSLPANNEPCHATSDRVGRDAVNGLGIHERDKDLSTALTDLATVRFCKEAPNLYKHRGLPETNVMNLDAADGIMRF
jgi:hypothetical protein